MARTLSDDDIQAIGKVVAEHQVCALGLTPDDAHIIKGHLCAWKKARNVVGSVVLTALGLLIVALFTKGFWASLLEGIKRQ